MGYEVSQYRDFRGERKDRERLIMPTPLADRVKGYILRFDLRKYFSSERSYREFMCKSVSELNKETAKHYGYEAQSNQLVEECAELIQAVSKYHRAYDKLSRSVGQNTRAVAKEKVEVALENLIEEIADVEIMLEQIKYLLQIPEDELEAVKLFKVNRTRERIIHNE